MSLFTLAFRLVGVISRSDLAIGAAGTTSWERTRLGLPTLLVPVADNQISISKFRSILTLRYFLIIVHLNLFVIPCLTHYVIWSLTLRLYLS